MFLDYLSLVIRRFVKDEEAASAIEYAIVAAMVAVIAAAFLTDIGARVKIMFNSVLTGLGGTAH